ncbi:hypothetical protein [Frigoriglobus tundricola]|uniref:Peptidyl-tRNA hydrolase, archaeal type n=1 Tax=Frigoriglobus tundricola TaxID=2774151 RepID=A0A6M5YSP4_9BACT|nr:hypothetical protein [Frigoriglobus tundricola]QJW97087.1 Peptidyl-tRNA hydrolase, archaeal type [Frigoriglobus tundricola]
MTDDEFLLAFETCTLARADWTHAAHVRMAWLYLTRSLGAAAALDRVRPGIQKLNAEFVRQLHLRGLTVPHDPRGLNGYHETITTAFVTVIAARTRAGEDFDTFRERNPDLFDRTFPSLLKHYSPERLYSAAAKAAFIAPDLAPLPVG